MAALYDTFRDAPVLGSLIDPTRSVAEDLLTAGFKELEPLLERALQDHSGEEEWEETAIAARGLADAAQLLGNHYHLVITNVPYLARGKQSERLRKFAEVHYPKAKNDLANVFLERCLELSRSAILALDVDAPSRRGLGSEKRLEAASTVGVVQIVMPQNWLFLTSYRKQREHLLKEVRWDLLARLGPGAFDTISGEVVNVILLTLTRVRPNVEDQLHGINASAPRTAAGKAEVLRQGEVVAVSQWGQLGNPDARVALEETTGELLAQYATALNGMHGADSPRFRLFFWEPSALINWRLLQNTVDTTVDFAGRSQIFSWPENGDIHRNNPHARIQGDLGWGQVGVTVSMMRELPCALYTGEAFDISCSPIIPQNSSHLPAIWCFCSSPEYNEAVRRIDQKLNVTNATLVKVPFDLDHWTQIAKERYPNGLPKPYSNDPTQWIFHGHPCGSVVWDEEKKRLEVASTLRTDATVLQIAVARLLGYRWPAEGRSAVPALLPWLTSSAHGWRKPRRCIASRMRTALSASPRCAASGPLPSGCWNCCAPPTTLTPALSRREREAGTTASSPNSSLRQANKASKTGCATSSSNSTASCSTTAPSSGTSGMAASAMVSMLWSTTTSLPKAMAGGCWNPSPTATSATGSPVRRTA